MFRIEAKATLGSRFQRLPFWKILPWGVALQAKWEGASGVKYVLWRQVDTDKISLRHFIFVTWLRQERYDDRVEV
jgi:hypothetical protein